MGDVAVLTNKGKILVKEKHLINKLISSDYGSLSDGILALDPYEALYLAYTGVISIVNEKGEKISFEKLISKFSVVDKDLWIKFILYHDLRKRGFITRSSYLGRVSFKVAPKREDRGIYPVIFYGLLEGKKIGFDQLREIMERAISLKKKIILAIVDKEGNITYYNISMSKATIKKEV